MINNRGTAAALTIWGIECCETNQKRPAKQGQKPGWAPAAAG